MGGGKGGGDVSTTIRYADYIESHHQDFLNEVETRRQAVIDDSPFSGRTPVAMDEGFFGLGFVLADFPSLYDMYGKFMAGLDIEVLYEEIFGNLMEGPVTHNLVSAEAAFLSDDLESTELPRFELGMRNINAVMSSTFVIGRALLEEARQKNLAKYSAGLQYALIPVASERWRAHLEWNKGVIGMYSEIMKLYFSAKIDVDTHNEEILVKDRLWPFTVLEYERAAIGALQGATTTNHKAAGGSTMSRLLSGALSGAAMGSMMMGGGGAGVAGGWMASAGGMAAGAGTAGAASGAMMGMAGGPAGMLIGGVIGGLASIL